MKEKKTLWLVVHTHWEGAVFKTRDEYLEDGFRIILNGLNLMQQHPDYRFVLDQACHAKPFLERYPEQRQILEHQRDGVQILGNPALREPTRREIFREGVEENFLDLQGRLPLSTEKTHV